MRTPKMLFAASAALLLPSLQALAERPNIILILADDMGIGDISAFNPDSKIRTTHLDALSGGGIRFTDAHSTSSVSTPSRYGVLTGRYCFRTTLKSWTPNGFADPLIAPQRKTVAGMLQQQGYTTGCIGKWHLGWDWHYGEDKEVDYSKPIQNGPTTRGFDYSYCLSASLDMSPYVYVENDRVTALPNRITGNYNGLLLQRKGPAGADFEHSDVLPNFGRRAVKYVEDHKDGDKPFFLYLPLTAPHTPILPTEEYRGKTFHPYGDFVLMVDDIVGDVVEALKRTGQYENTIVIFTTDNGCAPYAEMDKMEEMGHYPSYIYRGAKADIFDGGHRIPLVMSWGGRHDHKVYDGIVALTDFYATFAEMTGYEVPADEAEDSYSMWKILNDKGKSQRKDVIHHSGDGIFSLRSGDWKMIFGRGSGGWSEPKDNSKAAANLPPVQLYNMDVDPGERSNLEAENPKVMQKLTTQMRKYLVDGRSTPGPKQPNDTDPFWPMTEIFMK